MMKRILVISLSLIVLVSACVPAIRWPYSFGDDFSSNGERIYFTASNEDGQRISYSGGPRSGGMMTGGAQTCAACHGDDGRGGRHFMHMSLMQAPDITFAALNGEQEEQNDSGDGHAHSNEGYDLEDFQQAVVFGRHPDGQALDNDMPRWRFSDEDLADLFEYIQTLP